MTRACPTCGSDRCGNHAACARRHEAATARDYAWTLLWAVVGMTEREIQRRLRGAPLLDPFALAWRMAPNRVRVMVGDYVLTEIDRRMNRRGGTP